MKHERHKRLSFAIVHKYLKQELNCMECGALSDSKNIHLHHINRDKTDDRLRNISVLCRKCHSQIHKEKGPTIVEKSSEPVNRPRKVSFQEKFNKKYGRLGGIEKLAEMYKDKDLALADIAIYFNVTRERVNQWARLISLPTRGRGFKHGIYDRKNHTYKHRVLDGWMKRTDMTAGELADKLGVGRHSVYGYLNDPNRIPLRRAKDISILSDGELTLDEIMQVHLATAVK